MNEESRRTQQMVAALDDIDYYHRLRWIDSIRYKRDAAMHYFESLLVQNASELEMNTGTRARNVLSLMTVCRVVSFSPSHNSDVVTICCEKKREHLK